MKIDIKKLPESLESSHEIILSLQKLLSEKETELSSFKSKYKNLVEQIRLAKQQRFSPASEKNVLQPDIFDEAGVELDEAVQEQISDTDDDEITVGSHTRKKHPARKPLPKDLPREVIVHDLTGAEKICGCGEQLVKIGEEITEQLKYIPAQLSVVRHVRPKYACKPCQENVKIAPMPILLLPKSIATPELVSHTIIAKYCDYLPLYRQEKIWSRLDVELPRNSLCGWVLKTAHVCEPLIRLLQKNIIAYDLTQADETPVQVMGEPERANTSTSYMWCYRGGGKNNLSIVYDYQETRGGYHAEQFLSGFKGFLQTDAYAGYHFAKKNQNMVPVGCHAHARRPFAQLAKLANSPSLAKEALQFYRKLYAVEESARKNNVSADARHKLRLEKSQPILAAFKKWLDHHLTKTSEQGKIGKAIRYCLSNWAELTNFLKDGRIEIDNNLIENAIRPFALGRKNWLFMGSPAGAKAGAIFYSLIETCKANCIDPQKYFNTMLHKIRLCQTEDDYRKLLPQNIQLS